MELAKDMFINNITVLFRMKANNPPLNKGRIVFYITNLYLNYTNQLGNIKDDISAISFSFFLKISLSKSEFHPLSSSYFSPPHFTTPNFASSLLIFNFALLFSTSFYFSKRCFRRIYHPGKLIIIG